MSGILRTISSVLYFQHIHLYYVVIQ